MKRKNSREDRMKLMRKGAIQPSPHTPLTDRLGTTENKIRKEIAIMKKCRHAHVVRLLEVIDDRMKHKVYLGECPNTLLRLPALVHVYVLNFDSPCHNIKTYRFIRRVIC